MPKKQSNDDGPPSRMIFCSEDDSIRMTSEQLIAEVERLRDLVAKLTKELGDR